MACVWFRQSAFSDGRLRAVEEYLYAHISDPARLPLAKAASIANLCPERFCRLFRERVGISFYRWQCAVRMDVAKRLLMRNRILAQAAGEAVGYDNPSTFGRVFKRCHGITPRALHCLIRTHPELTDAALRTESLADVVKVVNGGSRDRVPRGWAV